MGPEAEGWSPFSPGPATVQVPVLEPALGAAGPDVEADGVVSLVPDPGPEGAAAQLSVSGSSSLGAGASDGKNDLVWRNVGAGKNQAWEMSGVVRDAVHQLVDVPAPWEIVGVGDFGGTGQADDLVWRNGSNGGTVVWQMEGPAFVSDHPLGRVGTVWEVSGVGDFEGTGDRDDLLWRNTENGTLVIWLMNGVSRTGDVALGRVGGAWRVVAVGDFEGTGMPDDFAWRNPNNGGTVIWWRSGTSGAHDDHPLKRVSAPWEVQAAGDFELDGRDNDLVWRNPERGVNVVWLTDGSGSTGQERLPNVFGNWNISGTSQLAPAQNQAPPSISSISPDPLLEGDPAAISGTGFSPQPAQNVVTIDGVQAVVTGATETTLQVTVPTFDCRPGRSVEVQVSVSEQSSEAVTATMQPKESSIQLEVGHLQTIQTPADFCLQFDESAADEAYLLGVQSTSDVVSSLTPVTITSVAAASEASGAIVSLATDTRPGQAAVPRLQPSHWEDHRRAEAELRRREREHLLSRDLTASAIRDAAAITQAQVPAIGDTLTIRVPDISSTNACVSFQEIDAVVRAVGQWGIWLEDAGNPSSGFTGADFQAMSDQFDDAIYDTDVTYFGPPTDIDANGRILVVVSKELNLMSSGTLGFVFGGDLLSRASCPSSDEAEAFYGQAPDPTGLFGPPYATADARLDYPFIIAHELTHVIQLSRRLAAAQPLMDAWMMEAQATLGEEVVGHEVTGRSPGNDYGYDVAFNSMNVDPIDWYTNGFVDLAFYFGFESSTSRIEEAPDQCGWLRSDPSPCLGRELWYGVGWSFLRWTSDHFGPSHVDGEVGLHRDLVDSGQTGFQNVTSVTGETKETLLAEWASMLYVDDRVASAVPRLTMPSWNLFNIFEENLVETARLTPLLLPFDSFEAVGSVRAGSAGYLRLQGSGRPPTAVRIRDSADGTLPASMQVWIVRLQ